MSSAKKGDLVYKALADRRRREILDLLKDEPKTTGDICAKFKRLDRCTVMQHLGVLEKAGLIFTKRVGRFRWNYLNAVPIREISKSRGEGLASAIHFSANSGPKKR